ncbi:MAG: hypothetical protein AUH85_14595 [Chloroflexi bacterium 13_1_40CM_4_68_4]|nr:MAG: hypothetical protein AUH85_14595 [Chloroflexi bacterium 13_1_40CM_4_68_4]
MGEPDRAHPPQADAGLRRSSRVVVRAARVRALPRPLARGHGRGGPGRPRKHRVATPAQLVRLVERCGFCYAFTEGDLPIPACFDHLATRSVDRMWGWMWTWKDELPEQGKIYYGKLLHGKPTFVALPFLPFFYAVHGRAGEDDDYLEDVRSGRITDTARRIYEALAHLGETQTKRLRAELGIESKQGRAEYAKAIEELQRLFYVTRVRAVGEGREDYNYTYDVFTRRYPDVVRRAARISSHEAMRAILGRALDLAGGLPQAQLSRVFGWPDERVERVVDELASDGKLVRVGVGRAALVVLPRLAKSVAA